MTTDCFHSFTHVTVNESCAQKLLMLIIKSHEQVAFIQMKRAIYNNFVKIIPGSGYTIFLSVTVVTESD